MTTLGEIADVQLGFTFRSSLEPTVDGPTPVIQMRDLRDDQTVDLRTLARVAIVPPATQRARVGDIVLRSRGDRVTSAIVADDPGEAIVAAPLLRIRVNREDVLPAFLNWYINQAPAQAHLNRHNEGSYVKMLRRAAVDDLEIDLPSFERQQTIVELAGLLTRARALESDLDRLRARHLTDTMIRYAKGGEAR
jgi:hypothetical protein